MLKGQDKRRHGRTVRFRQSQALGALLLFVALMGSIKVSVTEANTTQSVVPGARYLSFHLHGSNGYEISVNSVGRKSIQVGAGNRDGGFVVYLVPARITANRLEARIGNLGEISMRFHPSAPAEKTSEPQGDCKGRKALIQPGVFVGSFALHGEHGYTTAGTTRVLGLAVHSFREVCKGEDAGPNNTQSSETTLRARSRAGKRRTVEFRASSRTSPHEEIVEFEARTLESRPNMTIERLAYTSGETSDFAFDVTTGTVAVAPPRLPFTGTATFQPNDAPPLKWSGSLAAWFPGLGEIALAGRRFSARISIR
jgi:hypothetical protein